MSEFHIISTSAPVPPTVPTSFTTDVRNNDGTLSPGTAIPSGNNLQILGRDTIQNSVNGIRTDADPNNGSIVYVELTNRTLVTSTTSDAAGQFQVVTIFTPPISSAIQFNVSFCAYDSLNNQAAGGSMEGLARRSGAGTTVVIGTNDTFEESDTAAPGVGLSTADWDIITDGTQIQAQFVGILGRTINWSVVFTYNQVQ